MFKIFSLDSSGKSYLFSNKIVFSCRDKPGCGVFIYVTPIIEEQN